MATAILQACRPCIRCGAQDRNNKGECRACKRARDSAYRSANAEKIAAYMKVYYANNRDHLIAVASKYLADNKDAINKAERERYKKEDHWRVKNPEKHKARLAEYLAQNREARRIYEHNRRARKRSAGGEISHGIAKRLFALQKGLCPCCNRQLGKDYHMDHIIPLALGGSNDDGNMQLLRAECNLEKQAKHPVDFMQSRGFLL